MPRGAAPGAAPLLGGAGEEHIAPRSPLERAVAAAWAEALGTERVGLGSDFFERGPTLSVLLALPARRRRCPWDLLSPSPDDLPLNGCWQTLAMGDQHRPWAPEKGSIAPPHGKGGA